MSIKEEIYRAYTNTKTPGVLRLFITLAILIVGGVAGYHGEKVLDWAYSTEEVQGYALSLDKDDLGYFFPITVKNVGTRPLTNVKLNLSVCGISSKQILLGTLSEDEIRSLEVRDKKTRDLLNKGSCSSEVAVSKQICTARIYDIDGRSLYLEPTVCEFYRCTLCTLNATIAADQVEELVHFNTTYVIPRLYKVYLNPEIVKNVETGKLKTYTNMTLDIETPINHCLQTDSCDPNMFSTVVNGYWGSLPPYKYNFTVQYGKRMPVNVFVEYKE